MAMISLKHYFNASGEETSFAQVETSLRQTVSLLVSAMGSSAVDGDLAEFPDFRAEIEQIRDGLTPDLPPENLMDLAETAARTLTGYNKRVKALLVGQGSEVKHILKMLQDTVINIAGENTRSGKRLHEITLELEQGGAITDLRVLKGRLTDCLKDLREETLQQKTEAAGTMLKLQMTIEQSRGAVAKAGTSLDPVTGLPGRDEALIAMQAAIDGGVRQYAVIMVVNRVQMVNARFGHEVGDRMLVVFKEHMAKQLSSRDRLFRWAGPAFVAILERDVPLGIVRLLAKRMMEAKIEVDYSGDGRSVLIPVSAVWSALPLTSASDADKQIQTFVASQSTGDYA
jgi:GGDEF domain-containing protein